MLKGYNSKLLPYVFCCYFSNKIELEISMKQLLIIYIVSFSVFAHGQNEEYSSSINGLLGKEKVLTYWDFDSTQVRSEGYLNNKGWNDIGSKQGRWTFYYKNGNKEEIAIYDRGYLNGKVTRFYENGKIQQDGWFKWDLQDSTYRAFFNDGSKAEEGQYKMGEEVGVWIVWYRPSDQLSTHQKKEHFEYKDSVKYLWNYWTEDGQQLIVDGNGILKSHYSELRINEQTTYANGLMTGPSEKYNPAGKPRISGTHLNGKKTGKWKFYFVDGGAIDREANFNDDLLHGEYKAYFKSGIVLREGEWDMGKKIGHWIWRDRTGQKDMEGDFNEDLQEGKWTYYYPNGNIHYTGLFEKGLKTGTWNYFYKDGSKWKTGEYENDLKQGNWLTWFENGAELQKGTYLDGVEEGKWNSWYESGTEKDEGNFQAGSMDGQWKGWYPNGQLSYKGAYTRDMKTGSWTYYFDDGKLRDQGSWKIIRKKSEMEALIAENERFSEGSYKEGLWISFSQIDGAKVASGSYKMGVKEGKWMHYYPGGIIVAYENEFKNGNLNGKTTQYSRRGKKLSETSYKSNKRHGPMIIYGKRNKVIYHAVYKNGNVDKVITERGQPTLQSR